MPFSYGTAYTVTTNLVNTNFNSPAGSVAVAWHGSAPFAKASGDDRFVLARNVDVSNADRALWPFLGLACWHSADHGQTWTEADASNRPTGPATGAGQMPFAWDYSADGNSVYVAYQNTSGNLAIVAFDMATATWGTPSASSIALTSPRSMVPVVRADGSLVIAYSHGSPSVTSHAVTWSGGSWGSPVALGTSFNREVHSGVYHPPTGNVYFVGENSLQFVRSIGYRPDNTLTSAVLLPTGAWAGNGSKLSLIDGKLVIGQLWYDDPPAELKLLPCVGTFSGETVTWAGTLSGVLALPASPTGPTRPFPLDAPNWQADSYYDGACVPLSTSEIWHFTPLQYVDDTWVTSYPEWDGEGNWHSFIRKHTSSISGVVDELSGGSPYEIRMIVWVVCVARLPNGNVALFWEEQDVAGAAVDDTRIRYMELQAGVLPANRWYAI